MKLVFFGGVQGVGKSTLLSWLEEQFRGRVVLLNPGELFRQYFYRERLKTVNEIEEMIVQEIERYPNDAIVVLHWHYAVPRPEGFIPQISFSRLERLARSGKIQQAILLSVQAPIDTIYERRVKDRQDKKREFSKESIRREINADRKFLAKHRGIFTEALGEDRVTELLILNEDLTAAQAELHKFFTNFLNSQEET